jgi:multidrug transporter EmrE-like cation transporter
LGVFYPVIKLFEIFVPILVGIFLYKEKYNYYNYFGVLLAIVAIFLITLK